MASVDTLVENLRTRLPELEWKLRQVSRGAFLASVPPHFFRTKQPESPTAYLDEIRNDLASLSQQMSHGHSAHLIADRIHSKIDLLVRLCIFHGPADVPARDFAKNLMTKLVTRRQQVQDIEDQIILLQEQQSALKKTLSQTKDVERQLLIQAELGNLERLLTHAKEALN